MRARTEKPPVNELSQLQSSSKLVSFCIQDGERTQFYSGKIKSIRDFHNGDALVWLHGESTGLYLRNVKFWSDQTDFKTDTSSFFPVLLGNNDRYVELFNQLKSKFERINSTHFDEFQTRDTEKFFLDHAMKISLLVQIMGESAFKWMSDQLAQTVLPLERLLDGIPQQFPVEILSFLKNFFEQNQQAILTKDGLADWKNIIIGISTQLKYNSSLSGKNAAEQVRVYQSFTGNIKQFSESVNNGLLDSIYDTLHLSVEARSLIDRRKLFEAIPLDQFAALARERKSMGDSHPHAAILEKLIDCYLTGRSIHDFLHNPHQASDVGVALAAHNANIRAILSDKSINPELALHYPETYEFSYAPPGFEIEYERSQATKALHAVLSDLHKKAVFAKSTIADAKQISQFDSIIRGLDKLLEIDTKIEKLKIDPQKFYEQQNFGILESIQKNINALGKNETIKANPACQEFLATSEEFTKQFERVVAQKTISTASTKSATGNPAHFRIEQWDKEKISTLFLGNEVDCCLAVGSGAFPAIVQRIMDDAMLFHVVVDLETQKPIALTWLYLATDQNGDINLVGNFVEIKAKYGANEEARETIINALMHYSGEMYCRDNTGIKGFIINELTYGWNAGKIPFREKPVTLVDKVGGAFAPDISIEERAQQGRKFTCDRYYLQSLQRILDTQVANFHIYEPKQLTPEQRQKFASVEERIFQIVNKHITHQKKQNSGISNEELIRVIDPLIRNEVRGKMGAFFDGASPEKLSSILERAYDVVIQDKPRHAPLLFSPNIDALYPYIIETPLGYIGLTRVVKETPDELNRLFQLAKNDKNIRDNLAKGLLLEIEKGASCIHDMNVDQFLELFELAKIDQSIRTAIAGALTTKDNTHWTYLNKITKENMPAKLNTLFILANQHDSDGTIKNTLAEVLTTKDNYGSTWLHKIMKYAPDQLDNLFKLAENNDDVKKALATALTLPDSLNRTCLHKIIKYAPDQLDNLFDFAKKHDDVKRALAIALTLPASDGRTCLHKMAKHAPEKLTALSSSFPELFPPSVASNKSGLFSHDANPCAGDETTQSNQPKYPQ